VTTAEGYVETPEVVKPTVTSRSRWASPVAAALAAAVMVAGLVLWWQAAHDDGLDLARTRDAVLIAATGNIETMNSLDYAHVEDGLMSWSKVTTGTLHDQITQISADNRKLLADQKKVSVGKVVAAAVTSVDATKASVIASLEVTVRDGADPAAEPSVKRNRFSADLVLVRGHWLLERLDQVAVNVS
jgi:Mce-associated membrane protein